MGKIQRFDLTRLQKDFSTKVFFETGTFTGDGVAWALQTPFDKVESVEIVPELAQKCRERFSGNDKVIIHQSDSVTALQQRLPQIKGNILFWLDAHFPGADAGLQSYEGEAENIRLPLEEELRTIASLRKKNRDVFILDDLRIYEDGNYENGNVPADALPVGSRNIDFVIELFEPTHRIMRLYRDEGYILLLPKKKYFQKHFRISNLFGKPLEDDPYYVD